MCAEADLFKFRVLSTFRKRCLLSILVAVKMRADIFHHGLRLLLSKFSAEADLTHELSKLLSEKANLTEALGVSADFGGLMQATYEEMVESNVLEMPSQGMVGLLEPLTTLLIVAGVLFCLCSCCAGCAGALIQTGEGSEASEASKEASPKLMKKAAMKLFEMKFGKGSGADFQDCMDEVSLEGAWTLRDSFDLMTQSMKTTLASLEDAAASHAKLLEKLEDEEMEMEVDESKVEKSELWRIVRGIQIANRNAYVSNPWSPESLQIMKMPGADTFSLSNLKPASLYYKGICIPEQEYFKKHSVAIVSSSNAKVPQGTVVKLDRVQTIGTGRGAYFTQGGYQTRLRLSDLSFGLIPKDSGALQWLAAINRSLPDLEVQDPSDPSRVFLAEA
eukprot:Skav217315  [mRNA]  locus=scaffold3163:222198:224342:+ [translate_table: standard]